MSTPTFEFGGDLANDVPSPRLSGEPHHEPGIDWAESDESTAIFDMDNDGRLDVFLDGAAAENSRGRLLRNATVFTPNNAKLSFIGAAASLLRVRTVYQASGHVSASRLGRE